MQKKAFTLIELLIVVAIIAILAAIAIPNFLEAQTRSKVARTKADMRSLKLSLEAYRVDNNTYPEGRDCNNLWMAGLSRRSRSIPARFAHNSNCLHPTPFPMMYSLRCQIKQSPATRKAPSSNLLRKYHTWFFGANKDAIGYWVRGTRKFQPTRVILIGLLDPWPQS
jgi:prepilin-type N-terminal cleavage/methylation domain-containing protein